MLAVNSTPIHIDGTITLPVIVDHNRFHSTLLVSPNIDEVILGRDWLTQHKVTWQFGSSHVTIGCHRVRLRHVSRCIASCKRVRASCDMTIPALSESNIPVDIVFGKSWGSPREMRWTTIPTEACPGVRVARTLINHEAPFAVVRVCNTTRHPVNIRQYLSLIHI